MNRRTFLKMCSIAAGGGVLGAGKAEVAQTPINIDLGVRQHHLHCWHQDLIRIEAEDVCITPDGIYADGKYIAQCPGHGFMFIAKTYRWETDPNAVRITNIMRI